MIGRRRNDVSLNRCFILSMQQTQTQPFLESLYWNLSLIETLSSDDSSFRKSWKIRTLRVWVNLPYLTVHVLRLRLLRMSQCECWTDTWCSPTFKLFLGFRLHFMAFISWRSLLSCHHVITVACTWVHISVSIVICTECTTEPLRCGWKLLKVRENWERQIILRLILESVYQVWAFEGIVFSSTLLCTLWLSRGRVMGP